MNGGNRRFKIMSTMGHVMDLPPKKLGVTMDDGIEIEYVPIKDKASVIAEICKAAQKADTVYLGPDPDHEGEIILKKYEPGCILCGKIEGLRNIKGKNLCGNCIAEIQN